MGVLLEISSNRWVHPRTSGSLKILTTAVSHGGANQVQTGPRMTDDDRPVDKTDRIPNTP